MIRDFETEYLIGVYPEGKCFGQYSCLSGRPNPFTAADVDSVIMEIPRKDIHNYISINPRNAEQMLMDMSKQMALMSKHIEMLRSELQEQTH